jgi:hypothetical protein
MAHVIIGAFSTQSDVERVIEELERIGFGTHDLGILMPTGGPAMGTRQQAVMDANVRTVEQGDVPTSGRSDYVTHTSWTSPDSPLSTLPYLGVLTIPGFGEATVGGIFANMLTGEIHDTVSSLCTRMGLTQPEALLAEQLFNKGYALLAVNAGDFQVQAVEVLTYYSPVKILGLEVEEDITATTTPVALDTINPEPEANDTTVPWVLQPGYLVSTQDQEKLGYVELVRDNYFMVGKGLLVFHELFIPYEAIQAVEEDTVLLKVFKDEIKTMGWEQPGANVQDVLADYDEGHIPPPLL